MRVCAACRRRGKLYSHIHSVRQSAQDNSRSPGQTPWNHAADFRQAGFFLRHHMKMNRADFEKQKRPASRCASDSQPILLRRWHIWSPRRTEDYNFHFVRSPTKIWLNLEVTRTLYCCEHDSYDTVIYFEAHTGAFSRKFASSVRISSMFSLIAHTVGWIFFAPSIPFRHCKIAGY